MTNISFAVARADTTGTVQSGSDATDARFWTPVDFSESDHLFTDAHVDRFGSDSLSWLLNKTQQALEEWTK